MGKKKEVNLDYHTNFAVSHILSSCLKIETNSRGYGINIISYAICNLRIMLCIARTFKCQNSPHLILSKTTS